MCGAWSRSLRKFFVFGIFFFGGGGGGGGGEGGGGMFLQEIVLVVALQRSVTSCLLVMSQCKIGIVITILYFYMVKTVLNLKTAKQVQIIIGTQIYEGLKRIYFYGDLKVLTIVLLCQL